MSITIKSDDNVLIIERVGGSGGSIPAPTGNDGYALIEIGSIAAFRPIKNAYIVADFDITGFSPGVAVLEVGASVISPNFGATYNRTPDTATLTDDEGTPAKDVSGTPLAFTSDATFLKTANNDSVLFTLSATEDGDPDARNTSIAWQPRTFIGVDVDGLSTEADIESLSTQQLDSNRQTTFNITAGAGQHIYYAFPSSYGTPTFFVGGFEGGFVLQAGAVSVTNAFGVTQTYDLWKSTNANLGNTTVVVT